MRRRRNCALQSDLTNHSLVNWLWSVTIKERAEECVVRQNWNSRISSSSNIILVINSIIVTRGHESSWNRTGLNKIILPSFKIHMFQSKNDNCSMSKFKKKTKTLKIQVPSENVRNRNVLVLITSKLNWTWITSRDFSQWYTEILWK